MTSGWMHRLARHAERVSEAPSLRGQGRIITAAELLLGLRRWRAHLRASDVGPQGRVLAVASASVDGAMRTLGIAASATYTPISAAWGGEAFEDLLQHIQPHALIVDDQTPKLLVQQARARALRLVSTILPPLANVGGQTSAEERDTLSSPERIALLLHTSGTTSRKYVPLSNRNITSAVDNIQTALALSDRDRCLNMLPLHHSFGLLCGLFAPLVVGGSVEVAGAFTPTAFWQQLSASAATWFPAVPTMHRALLETQGPDVPRVRLVVSAAAPLDAQTAAGLRHRLQVPVVECYGMTEAGLIASTPLSHEAVEPGSVGRACGLGIAVRNPTTGASLTGGERGEVVIRGDAVAQTYFADGRRAAPRADAWFETGDEGFFDRDGALHLCGRLRDRINQGGETLSPGLIERALQSHPGVHEAACFGMPHSRLGQAVAAAVVASEQVSDAELRALVAERLGLSSVPHVLLRRPSLPRAANGKLQRRGLYAHLREQVEAHVSARTDAAAQVMDDVLVDAIAVVYARVLGVVHVGREQSFFALGGDSLGAMEVANRLRILLKRSVSGADLFTHSSPHELATRLRATAATDDALLIRLPRWGQQGARASFGQERMWLHQQLFPESCAYNEVRLWRVRGSLDAGALEQALRWLIERHEVLRSRLVMREEHLVQLEGALPDPVLRTLAVANASVEEGLAAIRRATSEPFDLATEAPCRFWLVAVHPELHLFAMCIHHVAVDGLSAEVLYRDLAAKYRAVLDDDDFVVPSLPVRYSDWALWQRRQVQVDSHRRLSWWQERLKGAPTLLPLPYDHQRPDRRRFKGGCVTLSLDVQQCAAVEQLATDHDCTPYMVLLSAFALTLSRTCDSADLVIGTPVSGRAHPAVQGLMGFFVNTVALRLELGGALSGSALLQQVRSACLETFARQDVPFEHVVDALGVERATGYAPLVQVMFAYQSFADAALKLAGTTAESLRLDSTSCKLDLTLSVELDGERRRCRFEYDADLFDASSIARLTRSFELLLQGLVAEPRREMRALPMLSESERQELLSLGQGPIPTAPTLCLHQLVERQVDATPEETALVFGDTSLSYAELDRRANGVAHHLLALGVQPNSLVGLSCHRSLEMIAALLGILKAGCAYVPLDPAYPRARLSFMAEDAGLQVVLTQADLLELWSEVQAIDVEHIPLVADRPALAVTPSQRAYVLYTSGSTGRPKGVEVAHRSSVSALHDLMKAQRLGPTSRMLQFASLSFDTSLLEIMPTLFAGGAVVLAAPDQQLGEALTRTLQHQRITHLQMVPSALASVPDAHARDALRVVIVAGEVCPPELVRRWGKGRHFLNEYGPTECFVSTLSVNPSGTERVPIGRPLPGYRVYVLDEQRQLVPMGVPGELYIGGVGVALGYLNRPALTAERFVADPFGPPGARMYRTGDRCRWRSDGQLDFLGRTDFQVKLRGHRIELGEIEACLDEHPAVRQVVVMLRDEQLVAYIVVAESESMSPATLRAHVQAQLPAHLVPTAYVELPALPRLPNGKLNRKALPAPDEDALGVAESHVPPRTDDEQTIAAIWADVLGLDRVGVTQDFFALGGHSLLVLRVCMRLEVALKRPVPARALFEAPTVAQLATWMQTRRETPLRHAPIEPTEHDGALPLSWSQERFWFLEQLSGASATFNIPMAWRLRGSLDIPRLERSFTALFARHASLRTTFSSQDGQPSQQIRAPRPVRLEVQSVASAEVQALVDAEALRIFDLAQGPLFRILLLAVAPEEHVLMCTVHHMVFDGASGRLLEAELSRLYAGEVLDEPALQYADYALWQRRWVDEATLATQLNYWRDALAGAPALLELPTDRPRPRQRSTAGASHPVEFDAQLSRRVDAFARGHHCTAHMVLLSAFQVLLARYAGVEDLVVGVPIAGRNHVQVEPLVGLFINSLAIRGDLSGEPSFVDLVARTRQRMLSAFENQDLPFEKLVSALQPIRSLEHAPVFQVLFQLVEQTEDEPLRLGTLESTPVEITRRVSELDLTLNLFRASDGGIAGTLAYATDLFDTTTTARMVIHLQGLLHSLLETPTASVLRVSMIREEAERQELLSLGQGRAPTAPALCLHQLIERQMDATPEATALVFGDTSLSYAELDRRANGVAHQLQALGVQPGSLVGLSCHRSLEMVAALLGILKAGCAYVPLDPAYPRARLSFMAEDTGLQMVLTQAALLELWSDVQAVAIESIEPVGDRPALTVTPSQRAYVLYTSGSTGRPKGVMVSHRSVVHSMHSWVEALRLQPGSRMLQFASLSFDASVAEIVPTLFAGATLVLANPDQPVGTDFTRMLQHQRITHLLMVPSVLACVPDADACDGLRVVNVAGEVCPPQLARRWSKGRRFINGYGPTECSVAAAVSVDPAGPGRIPIGQPLPGYRVYVLDEYRRLVLKGVPGELYIGGVGVALGYLNRPELTAERFVADPFGPSGARMYRTGDRCRWRSDGQLDFLGRMDFQVKLRGHRIELGEIEACLDEHPAVRQAVVVLRDDRLVAYIVAAESESVSPAKLRAHVQAQLPAHLVPTAYVELPRLPRLPNGKLDRKALPAPDEDALGAAASYVAPRTAEEQTVAAIWAEVLGLKRVGVTQDFFSLGGDSLMAVQLTTRMAAALDRPVSIRALFKWPTIAGLLAGLTPAAADKSSTSVATTSPERSSSRPAQAQDSVHLRVVNQSLPDLFLAGEVPSVDAAYLGYVPDDYLDWLEPDERRLAERDLLVRPTWVEVLQTPVGRTAGIVLPHRSSELYVDQDALVESIIAGLAFAGRIGAQVVSLTGLLPSATEYGQAIARATAGRTHLPAVSTGHGATGAAVLMNLERLLELSHRALVEERVAVLGLGSIGQTVLRLMLSRAPHPAELLLCDLYHKRQTLHALREEVRNRFGYRGVIELLEVDGTLPDRLYDATTVLGATNVPDVLNVERVAPGTLIVDDSGPHCFNVAEARYRFDNQGDILFIEGGPVESPTEVHLTIHPSSFGTRRTGSYDARTLMGCVLSGPLAATTGLTPTLGLISLAQTQAHLDTLRSLGFRGAWPQCEQTRWAAGDIAGFANRFGRHL